MSFRDFIDDPRIKRIALHPQDDGNRWHADLEPFLAGDASFTRKSAGEAGIKAVQRMMVFLGYSTSSSGAFAIDGDFGRGTNRGVAQFQVENRLTESISRDTLCYPCRWNTARALITSIPDTRLTPATLEKMFEVAIRRIENGTVMTGRIEDAIFHLNALDKHDYLNCRQILQRYGETAQTVSREIERETGDLVAAEWLLSIIRQETAGVIRPRFEQHYLSRLNHEHPDTDLEELRMRSMSMGLGQIMGANYKVVGAQSATELFTAPTDRQMAFVARFLRAKKDVVKKANPSAVDFREIARYYNGPKYEAHHYHESLERWFREFRLLMA